MVDRDLFRRSPSFERLLRKRPSFSRPPIRSVYSPQLTEDEAEMLTSPFLTYRTKYTYANSSCYNPDLPSSWEVPNLAHSAEEYSSPYIHVASPSFFYVLWSYFVWIIEFIIYAVRKVFYTLFREGPVALFVLLYDLCCFIYYGLKSANNRVDSLFSAPFELLDKIGRATYALWYKMSGTPGYNLRPSNRMSSLEPDHVRFSPAVTSSSLDDDDDMESTYSLRTRSARPVHNLRNRMVTEMVTDTEDEDEGYYEKRHHYQQSATPLRSSLKRNYQEQQPPSKARRIAHFLGSTASTLVSGVYWIIIEIITFFNRIIYGSQHRVKHMLSRPDYTRNTKAMYTRRSTRRRAISSDDDDLDDGDEQVEYYQQDANQSKLPYPLNLVSNTVYHILYGIMKIALAAIFAVVDLFRFFKNVLQNGAHRLYLKGKSFIYGLNHIVVPSTDDPDTVEVVEINPLTRMSDELPNIAWMPYNFLNWLGIKTMQTLDALGEKKRLLLWLLPLLLLLLILLARRDDHYPAPLEQNVKDAKESLSDRAAHVLSPDGKVGEKVKSYFHHATDSAADLKDRVTGFFGHSGRSTWNAITRSPSYLWNTIKKGPSGLYDFVTDTLHTVRSSAYYTIAGIWDTIKFSVYFMWYLARSIFHDVILGGLQKVWETIKYCYYFTEYFVRAVWRDIIKGGLHKAWEGIKFAFYFATYFVRAVFSDVIHPILLKLWETIKFCFYFITHFGRSVFADIIYPVLSKIWESIRFCYYFITHFVHSIYADFLSPIVYKIWEYIQFSFYFVQYFFKTFLGEGIYNIVSKTCEGIRFAVLFVWNFVLDIFGYTRAYVAHVLDKTVAQLPNDDSFKRMVDVDSLKETVNDYYQSLPSLPTLNKMPDIPELPLQLQPSYYKDYVPSQENATSTFWWILSMPKHFVDYTKSVFIEEKDFRVPPVAPNDEAAGIVNPPAPPAEIPKVHEERIISEVMKKLKIPEIEMKRIIKEVSEKLLAPKQDNDMATQEPVAKMTIPHHDEIVKQVSEKMTAHRVDEDKIIQEVTSKLQHDMENKIKIMMENYENKINAANIKHNNIEVDYTHLEALIRNAIYKYDADKTGLFDYALESAGAAVISTRCSESYNTYSRLEKIWNIPLWYSSYGPRTVIQRNSNSLFPGECWSFKTGRGYLTIDLSHKIKIGSISYEHISAEQAPDRNRNSAPRTFDFWAYKTEDDIAGRFLLGSFEYKLDEHPLQVFIIKNQPDFPVKIVEMEVTSNYGAEFTCLYRLRVHGDIYRGV